jgi:hypothetical protein
MTPFRILVMLVALAPALARADDTDTLNYPDPTGPAYTIKSQGERTPKTKLVLASVAGAGALIGALGLYYNLDSRSAADQLSALVATNRPWTRADQETYDRAGSSGTKATVFYSIGGAALIGAIVLYIVTEPETTTTVIRPHRAKPVVEPTPGGALLGGTWSF